MQWIKASERVPNFEPTHLVHLRFSTDKTKFSLTGYYKNGQWYRQYGEDNVLDWAPNLEWLDESPPASAVEEAERMYPYGQGKNIGLPFVTANGITDVQRSAHITCAGMYTGEIEKGREAIDILKALCALKKHKDTVGKDEYYEKAQPEVWKIANKFLEKNNL